MVTFVGGFAFLAFTYLANRPEKYRPDEENRDITRSLMRNAPEQAPVPRFTDATVSAGLSSFITFSGTRTSQLPEDMGPGVAWGDFDNDGDDDLFLVSAGGSLENSTDRLSPCELFVNQGDGTFQKSAEFPETRIRGMAAAWGDYDGDGFLDLAVSGYEALRLFHNIAGPDGRRFVSVADFEGFKGFWAGLAWGDFDNDRDLDLYVCGYVKYKNDAAGSTRKSEQMGTFVPYSLNPASYEPERNLLFENSGDGTFREVGRERGVVNEAGRSLGALWHDFDDDGWLDLYVANDISDNVLYRNVRGGFEDLSHPAWVADYRSAMGLAAGDWDRDGDDDLFITHWVAQENALYDNLFDDFNRKPEQTKRGAAGPDPEAKQYSLRFMDVADRVGLGQIALQYVGWGTEFADFDCDGWMDLVVANGNTIEAEGTPKRLKPQEAFLFWNQQGEHFYNLAEESALLSEKHVSRGLALSDYDHDGDMDILIAHLGEGVRLLRNEMEKGNWLELRLRSRLKNGAPLGLADGARVVVSGNGARMRRTVSSASYLSQSSRIQHFGLGSAKKAARVEVYWLGGGIDVFESLDCNARWEITEGDPVPKRLAGGQGAGENRSAADPSIAEKSSPNKKQIAEFWRLQRAAVNALKAEGDLTNAIALFRSALRLDPKHEDSRYYLSQCLVGLGDVSGALTELEALIRINPKNRKAYQQSGALRALHAASREDLKLAEQYLETAQKINPEETGVLLILGEISVMRMDFAIANERLSHACNSNPNAVGGFFLRAFLSWREGDASSALTLLAAARKALGADWKPKGTTSEGDVETKQHQETSPLARFWEDWDGVSDPEQVFGPLKEFLNSLDRRVE